MNYVNPRLQFLCRSYAQCPQCGDTKQQQIVTTWVTPAEWHCRMCKHQYWWEPENTPTIADAEKAIADAHPALARAGLLPLHVGTTHGGRDDEEGS